MYLTSKARCTYDILRRPDFYLVVCTVGLMYTFFPASGPGPARQLHIPEPPPPPPAAIAGPLT